MPEIKTAPGTVVAVDFSSDEETLITVSVPVDSAWGYECVTIVREPLRTPRSADSIPPLTTGGAP